MFYRASSRLILLHISGSRTLLHPPHPERDVDPNLLAAAAEKKEENMFWVAPRTGKTIPRVDALKAKSVEGENTIAEYLLERITSADEIRPAKDLTRVIKGWILFGEYLYILRPLVYGTLACCICQIYNGKMLSVVDKEMWITLLDTVVPNPCYGYF